MPKKILTAYRANKAHGVSPSRGSYAWRVERYIEKRFSVSHAIVVNSGTSALYVAIRALDLKAGEIVTSPITFSATAAAIVLAGHTPVFADVDPETFCITAETVKKAITKKTRAILPVHLFGRLARISEMVQLGFPIIEDACQAVGCWTLAGRRHASYSGCMGHIGAYSFGGRKQVTAGEGGALVTYSDELAYKARLMMNHGECFDGPVGFNFRPNEVTCKLILDGLEKLQDNTPFLEPYLVKKRGPNDRPYLDKHLGHYPAFAKYMRGPLPVADRLCRRTLCVR